MPDVEEGFVDPYALTNPEIAEIVEGCKTFPGDWFADPVIDYRRTGAPRVWVHPASGNNAFKLSLGFSKEDSLFYVAIQLHANGGDFPIQGIPFGKLSDALTMCQGSLMIVMKHAGQHALQECMRGMGGDRET